MQILLKQLDFLDKEHKYCYLSQILKKMRFMHLTLRMEKK